MLIEFAGYILEFSTTKKSTKNINKKTFYGEKTLMKSLKEY